MTDDDDDVSKDQRIPFDRMSLRKDARDGTTSEHAI